CLRTWSLLAVEIHVPAGVRAELVELVPDCERRADHGNRGRSRGRVERPVEDADAVVVRDDVALVEDDDAGRACGHSVVHLDPERARAALHEGDVPWRE